MAKDISSLLSIFDEKLQWGKVEIQDKIKKWVENNLNIKSPVSPPKTIEFGDVILFDICKVPHPCIIFKKENKTCYGIIISSKAHSHHSFMKIENSRIYTDSYFTLTIVSVLEDIALANFVNIFDKPTELTKAVRLLKTKYKDIL